MNYQIFIHLLENKQKNLKSSITLPIILEFKDDIFKILPSILEKYKETKIINNTINNIVLKINNKYLLKNIYGKLGYKESGKYEGYFLVKSIKEYENIYFVELEDVKSTKIEDNFSLDIEVDAGISILKGDKMDLTIQKLTELGINKIIPISVKRCIVKLDKKKDRWDTISKEALKQIEAKKYDISLKQNGIKEITYIGIAFCGKKIKISYK